MVAGRVMYSSLYCEAINCERSSGTNRSLPLYGINVQNEYMYANTRNISLSSSLLTTRLLIYPPYTYIYIYIPYIHIYIYIYTLGRTVAGRTRLGEQHTRTTRPADTYIPS
jgi:hypothetical protein